MKIIDANELQDTTTLNVDICIVGAGAPASPWRVSSMGPRTQCVSLKAADMGLTKRRRRSMTWR